MADQTDERLALVLALHYRDEPYFNMYGESLCRGCGKPWPCNTVKAANGDPEVSLSSIAKRLKDHPSITGREFDAALERVRSDERQEAERIVEAAQDEPSLWQKGVRTGLREIIRRLKERE